MQKIFAIPEPVGDKKAAAIMKEMDYKWAYPAIKMLDRYHEIDREEIAGAIEELQREWRMLWITIIAGGIILTTFDIFFAAFYTRLFTRPIEAIHNGAEKIAGGDFKVRLDIKTGDEIEQLSKAMNEMAKQLDTLYHNMGEKIEEGIKKFSAITESANDAIIVLIFPGIIHRWNKKAEEMFGYRVDEAIGKKIHGFIAPKRYREKGEEGLKNFFKTGQGPIIGKVVEVDGLRKDGTEFPIELSVSAFRIGEEWHAIGIIRDIAERKKSEIELKQRIEELEQFRKITIKRELRMEELKRRNKELEEELKIMKGMR
ncbi:MAG: PAS domain S-box protein [Nitrospinae bacterium]|nr:PAS domain S-box protein [Nitrospinota bacterium]